MARYSRVILEGKWINCILLILCFNTFGHQYKQTNTKSIKLFFHYYSPFVNTKFISLSFLYRFIIYKLPRYKIGEVGSGVDYMYLDSSVGSWQMSKFMVNTSQGAIGNTLSQLYTGKAYKVRLCLCSLSGFYTLIPL